MIGRRPFLLGAATAAFATTVFAQEAGGFAGDWYGVLEAGGQRLRLRFNVASGPVVTTYSIDQGNAPIPASEARIEGDRIYLRFAAIAASFEGRLAGERIEGVLTQGAAMPLSLGREPIDPDIPPPPRPPAPAPLTQQNLAALRAQCGAPAMAAAASRGDRSVAFADGVRAMGQPQTVTTSDHWHLGSITKSMTSTLVARLAEQGVVSWNDTVGDVLGRAAPQMRDEYRRATFRHLCSHRSGLPGNIEMTDFLSFPRENADPREDRVAYARIALAQTPAGAAEQTFLYSNSGYVIAGAMLEARTGVKWETLIRDHVFAPLGMTSAGQGAPGTPGAYDQPVGHAHGPNGLTPFPPSGPISDNPAVLGPAGRAHATLEDMLTFAAAHRDRTAFLRSESWDMLHTPPFGGDYAMGWVLRDDSLWHSGSNTLWYAELSFSRTAGVVSAGAANDGRASTGPFVNLARYDARLAVA